MTRLHADPVEVRTAAAADGPVPEQFLWRGRLYLVREVLARWTTSGSWWKPAQGERAEGRGERRASSGGGPPDVVGLDDQEQQWWRVEADSGRLAALSGGRGTYDLCFCWRTGWSLKRVLD